MFENIVGQGAARALAADIERGALPASLLFEGPFAAGKGTAALELSRYYSCEREGAERGAWNCSCPSCERQRALISPALLRTGPRECAPEIAAAQAAFFKEPASSGARNFFVRSIRALTCRFSPVLREGDPNTSKISGIMEGIDEDVDAFLALFPQGEEEIDTKTSERAAKLAAALQKACEKLESDFLGKEVSVREIRNASYWLHIASEHGKKTFIIENADAMNNEARNALLKTLEEPPSHAAIILTTTEKARLPATILSRVRPYRFAARDEKSEAEVLARVFHAPDSSPARTIADYLESFLPVSRREIEQAARAFSECGAKHEGAQAAVKKTLDSCAKFESPSLFVKFLTALSEVPLATPPLKRDAAWLSRAALWREAVEAAHTASQIYNQKPEAALESLYAALYS